MRIAFLAAANSWHIPVKTKYLVNQGHDVFYFQVYPGTNQSITPKGVTCIEIKSSLPNFLKSFHQLILVAKYSKLLYIDILHIVGMRYSYFSFVSKAKKNVIENNGSDVLVLPKKYKILKYLYSIIYKRSDAVVQDSFVTQLAGLNCGAPVSNNEIIELGIDFDIFNLNVPSGIVRRKLNLLTEKIIFSPRGFTDLYNIKTIIKSISLVKERYPNVKYVFCHHFGGEKDDYLKLIKDLDLVSNVIFTGFLDNEQELPYYYKDSDIVVSVPSSDSSPRSVYEAMACGIPVVISELPWYHSKFKKNENVFVVPVRDEIALANLIISFFDGNSKLCTQSAYEFVKNEINMFNSGQKLEKLYQNLLEKQ
jgi:glycosyltransferase involved in cell wall biosynthesis